VTVEDYAQFQNLVRQAFSQRRKTLRNTLKTLLDADAIRAAGVDPGVRPEQVTLEQYAALAEKM
jgi:16S rRNA (adenine1518-N6/adenine1519-N6)-dimethyltransferase